MQGISLSRPAYHQVGQSFPALCGGGLNVPSDLLQLLLSSDTPYYSDEEDHSGTFTHMLADRSRLAGDLREKRQGHCLDFDGAAQYVDGIPTTIVPETTSFSFAGWYRFDTVSATQQIVSQADGASGTGRTWLYYDHTNTEMRCYIGTLILSSGFLPFADTWYHIAVTWDHVTGTVTLNVNGSTSDRTGLTGNDGDGTIRIGASKAGSDPFDGQIYDWRLYEGKVLTAGEISYLRTFGQAGDDPGTDNLAAHYWLQEESGSVAYDASGNGNHADITGYVSSMRVTDTGVRYSVANEVGESPRCRFKDSGDYISIPEFTFPAGSYIEVSFSLAVAEKTTLLADSGTYVLQIDNASRASLRADGGMQPLFTFGQSLTPATTYTFKLERSSSGELINCLIDGVLVDTLEIGAGWTYSINQIGPLSYGSNVTIFKVDLNGEATYNGYGNTDADWVDLSGNGNDGTVVGSPDEINLPPQTGSTTQDALGGTLTYQGRAPMPGLAKHVAWQGNGTDVGVAIGTPGIPESADFSLKVFYLHKSSSARQGVVTQAVTKFRIQANARAYTAYSTNSLQCQLVQGDSIYIPNFLSVGDWFEIDVTRTGSDFSLAAKNLSTGEIGSVSGTSTGSIPQNAFVFVSQALNGTGNPTDGAVGPVAITTGGVTTTYVPIEGTRNVAKLTSDGSDTKIIYDAVVGGTLESIYSDGDGSWRLPHVENGARWDGTSLLPLDSQGNSPDGNEGNIAAGTLDRYDAITVDRTGGIVSPTDIELGLDQLTDEHGDDWVQNITTSLEVEYLRERDLDPVLDRFGEIIKLRV